MKLNNIKTMYISENLLHVFKLRIVMFIPILKMFTYIKNNNNIYNKLKILIVGTCCYNNLILFSENLIY